MCDLVRAQGPSQKQSSAIYEDQAAFLKSLTLHKESCEGKFWEEQESSLQPPGQVQDYPCPARSRHSRPTAAWPHRLVRHCLSRASTAQCAFPSGCCFLSPFVDSFPFSLFSSLPLASSLLMASVYSSLCLSASALTLHIFVSKPFREEILWVLLVSVQFKKRAGSEC